MKPIVRSSILLVSMVLAASLAWALTPHARLADEQTPIELESMVPRSFGDWTEVTTGSAAVVDPSRQQLIDKIYSETLSRIYVNSKNYMIMLSIAYGRDQSDDLQLHQPEVCYPAQGFTVMERSPHDITMDGRSISATRLNTQGPRPEPLTYWTIVGTQNYHGSVAKKLAQMSYGFNGKIPDGMLVRISSVDPLPANAYAQQETFAAAFADALPRSVRARFVGAPTPP